MHPEIPAISLICAVLVLIPLPWHLQARNIAIVSIIAWLFVVNLIYAVDAIVWMNNDKIIIPVWCDISSALITGLHIAMPTACLCICIHLNRLASSSQTSKTAATNYRIIFESLMCFGLPLVYIAIHFVVQNHRFDIFEGFGCRPTTFASVPAIFIVWVPPFLLCGVTLLFAGISWRRFQISARGLGSPLSMTRNGHTRLIAFSVLQAIWVIIAVSADLRSSLQRGLEPWTGLREVHEDFFQVLTYSTEDMSQSTTSYLVFSWLAIPVESVILFALFASSEDAVAGYMRCWGSFRHRFSHDKRSSGSNSTNSQENPMCFAVTFNDPFAPPPITLRDSPFSRSQASITKSVAELSITLQAPPPSCSSSPSSLQTHLEDDASFISATLSYLDSPTGRSAIASSHNSLESHFDPNLIIVSPLSWPEPPCTIPTRPPCRATRMGYVPQSKSQSSRVPFDGSVVQLASPPLPRRNKPVNGANRSSRNAIYMTVVKDYSHV